MSEKLEDFAKRIKANLLHSIATAANDDYTPPKTHERARYVARSESMRDAIELIDAMLFRIEQLEADIQAALTAAYARGAAEEREACAILCELVMEAGLDKWRAETLTKLAAAIRSRTGGENE